MTATDTPHTTDATAPTPRLAWDRLLIAATIALVVAEVLVQVLAQTVIPPLAIITVLGLVGLGMLRVRRRAGIAMLGVVALLWLVGSVGFAADHLQHPESGVDFAHAVIELTTLLTMVIAAVAAWRSAATTWTRRTGLGGVALVGVAVLVATAASVTASGEVALADDVTATVEHAEFPDVTVRSGGSLFIHNGDLFRHTFTVEGTDVDVELPSRRGARVVVELPVGTYDVICTVPGHEFMEGTLTVE